METTTKEMAMWQFEATWGRSSYSSMRVMEGEPQDRDSLFVEYDVEEFLGYMPKDLKVKWERA